MCEAFCVHHLTLELLLIRILRQIRQRVHPCADYYVVEFCLLRGSLVFVFNVPTLSIWHHARHCRVEFARRVDVSLCSEACNVLLDLSASRELIVVFVRVVAEAWELVQLPWHLQAELCVIAPPNATHIRFLFEKSAIYA